jgi:hypothetical protein
MKIKFWPMLWIKPLTNLLAAEVSITAINALIKEVWKCFIIQIIPANFAGLWIIADLTRYIEGGSQMPRLVCFG